jgi:hypothetical protein
MKNKKARLDVQGFYSMCEGNQTDFTDSPQGRSLLERNTHTLQNDADC